VTSGAAPRGIFSIAFAGDGHGVAVGGDYQRPRDTTANVALTDDGGATWRLPPGRPGGYRSSVAYVPGSRGRTFVAVGTSGSDFSVDGGETWVSIDTTGFNTVAFARDVGGLAGWAVGPEGRVAKWVGELPQAEPATLRVRVRKEPP
jgi:hypothetical protein